MTPVIVEGDHGTWWSWTIATAVLIVPLLACWVAAYRADSDNRKIERRSKGDPD